MKYLAIILMIFVIGCNDDEEYYETNSTKTNRSFDDTDYTDVNDTSSESSNTSNDTDNMNSDTANMLDELLGSADCLEGDIPEDSCIGGKFFIFSGEFTITNGKCNFIFEVVQCENGCSGPSKWQEHSHCSNDCDNIDVCINPPENYCPLDWVDSYVNYDKVGKCVCYEMYDCNCSYESIIIKDQGLCPIE